MQSDASVHSSLWDLLARDPQLPAPSVVILPKYTLLICFPLRHHLLTQLVRGRRHQWVSSSPTSTVLTPNDE